MLALKRKKEAGLEDEMAGAGVICDYKEKGKRIIMISTLTLLSH